MKKTTIVTVLIIILLGIMVTDLNFAGSDVFELFFRRLETDSFNEQSVSLNEENKADYKHSINRDLVIKRNGRDKFIINNDLGSIKITGEDRDNIDIKAKITIYSNKKEVAENYSKKLDIKSLKDTNNIEVNVPEKNRPEEVKSVKVDYIIKAPESLYLQLKNKYGLLEVNNFVNGVNLSNKYQESSIQNISGENIIINNKFGSLTLSDVSEGKEMKITTAYNKSKIQNIARDIKINASYGGTNLYNTENIVLESKYTDIEINQINGTLDADIEFGNIEVNDIKNSTRIDGKYTDVTVTLSRELEDYKIGAETKYGDIRSNLNENIEKEENSKKLTYSKGTGKKKIDLKTSYGDLNIK